MRTRIECGDACEAQKLASLALARDGGQECITSVINVVGSEAVIGLWDGSAHSVVLRDARGAEWFAGFVQSVTEGTHVIVSAEVAGSSVLVEKAPAQGAKAT